jgi:ammonia channel protein AmtB
MVYGLKVFDGGGGMTVFLYSGVCSLMIWIICLRNRQSVRKNKQSYYNFIMGFIGIIVAFISWPRFNVAGGVVSYINANTTSVASASYLQNSALANTFLGLVVAALMSLLFAAKDEKIDKLNHKLYLESFINGGIIISSYADLALNPVACILPAAIASVMTLLIGKFYLSEVGEDESLVKTIMRKHPRIFARLIYSFIGIIICSIVVAARDGVSPNLLNNNYSTIAGLEIAAYIIVLIIALVFGAITAVSINAYLGSRAKEE